MSDPATLDLEIYRGDDYVHQLIFVDDQIPPEPWDLSDHTFKAQIRDRPEFGTVVYAEFDIDDSQADIGIIVISLAAEATRFPLGYWDFQIDFGPSTETYLKGTVRMAGDVTQEVAI